TVVIAVCLGLFVVGGIWFTCWLAGENEIQDRQAKIDEALAREQANRDRQAKIDELNKNVRPLDMGSGLHTPDGGWKRSPSPQIRHEREPEPTTPEPLPPPVEKKDRVIESVKPVDATPYILEAVKLANDLPNMFATPIKVAEKKP